MGRYVLLFLDEKAGHRLWLGATLMCVAVMLIRPPQPTVAQFFFPLMLTTTIYAGPIAWPILVVGAWKFGLPGRSPMRGSWPIVVAAAVRDA